MEVVSSLFLEYRWKFCSLEGGHFPTNPRCPALNELPRAQYSKLIKGLGAQQAEAARAGARPFHRWILFGLCFPRTWLAILCCSGEADRSLHEGPSPWTCPLWLWDRGAKVLCSFVCSNSDKVENFFFKYQNCDWQMIITYYSTFYTWLNLGRGSRNWLLHTRSHKWHVTEWPAKFPFARLLIIKVMYICHKALRKTWVQNYFCTLLLFSSP